MIERRPNTITEQVGEFKRIVTVTNDRFWMILQGKRGAVQFMLMHNWSLLPRDRYEPIKPELQTILKPIPADLGYHSPEPMYEGHEPMECFLFDGQDCYYDGSGLSAEKPFEVLKQHGMDGVWSYLETYYNDLFNTETKEDQ